MNATRRPTETIESLASRAGFEIGLELTAKARRARLPVAEIPTIWLERTSGMSRFRVVKWIPKYLHWYLFAFGGKIPLEEIEAVARAKTSKENR